MPGSNMNINRTELHLWTRQMSNISRTIDCWLGAAVSDMPTHGVGYDKVILASESKQR